MLERLDAARLAEPDTDRAGAVPAVASARKPADRDHGVSLVEILVTIVVLGILASVTTLAIRGTTSTAEASACSADRATLERAVVAWRTHHQDEQLSVEQLVADQYLRGPSALHDLSPDGTAVPRGKCAGDPSGPASPTASSPPSGTLPAATPTDDGVTPDGSVTATPGAPVPPDPPSTNPSATNPGRPNPANGGR